MRNWFKRRPTPVALKVLYRHLDLARYNEEVLYGIVHTPEYDAKMAAEAAEYVAELQAGLEAERVGRA